MIEIVFVSTSQVTLAETEEGGLCRHVWSFKAEANRNVISLMLAAYNRLERRRRSQRWRRVYHYSIIVDALEGLEAIEKQDVPFPQEVIDAAVSAYTPICQSLITECRTKETK